MIIECAWCHRDLGAKEPLEDTAVTHSVCDVCQQKLLADIDKLPQRRAANPRRRRRKRR